MGYALKISDAELRRYGMMARLAIATEGEELDRAGIRPGVTIADVGCGPAAMSVELARLIGPTGRVIAIEPDPQARATAESVIAAAGAANVELRDGTASDTGLEPGSVDVVMLRHVLAHNGGCEQELVDHLASRVRPGGSVYLVDVDLTATRLLAADPDLADLTDKYVEFHRQRGNDPLVGLRLARLIGAAGLELVTYVGRYAIIAVEPGLRPPPWAAREAMVAEQILTREDVERWKVAFERLDAAEERPTMFAPNFVAIGRRRV